VRGMFREQSWKGCLWASLCRCKPNFRGLGVYVPRSVDCHPGSHGIICSSRTYMYYSVLQMVIKLPRSRESPPQPLRPLEPPFSEGRCSGDRTP
jgi:hypothetical protein